MLSVSKKFVNFYQPHDGLWTVSVDESRVELRDSPKLQYVGIPGKKTSIFQLEIEKCRKISKNKFIINILCLFSKFFTQKKKLPTTLHY